MEFGFGEDANVEKKNRHFDEVDDQAVENLGEVVCDIWCQCQSGNLSMEKDSLHQRNKSLAESSDGNLMS